MGPADRAPTTYEVSTWMHFPGEVQGVRAFVQHIIGVCVANMVVVRRIRIVSHGSPNHFWIGHDRIEVRTLSKYKSDLQKLDLYLVPGIALLEIFACETGQATELIRGLPKMFDSVPVTAYTQLQHGNQPEGTGPRVTCKKGRCQRH
jgi:hypothetical protein